MFVVEPVQLARKIDVAFPFRDIRGILWELLKTLTLGYGKPLSANGQGVLLRQLYYVPRNVLPFVYPVDRRMVLLLPPSCV